MMARGMFGVVRAHRAPKHGGYTIIEVLLFVALTSFLLVVAIANITAGQRQVQFTQGVRDFESQFNDVINDVPTGYYPSNSALTCTVGGPRPVIDDTGGSGLGKSDDCMYVGKALQFRPDADDTKVLVYTLAGQRLLAGNPVTSLDEAAPVAVAKPSDATFQDTVVEIPLRNGVRIDKVFNGDGVDPVPADLQYGSLAIMVTFEGSAPSGDVSQAVQIGGIKGTILGENEQAAYTLINKLQTISPGNDGEFVKPNSGLVICLVDGDRRASITTGVSGGSGTKLDIDTYDQRCNP